MEVVLNNEGYKSLIRIMYQSTCKSLLTNRLEYRFLLTLLDDNLSYDIVYTETNVFGVYSWFHHWYSHQE